MCLHTNSAELCINFAYCMCNVYANLRWIIISITFMRHFNFLCSSFGLKQKTLSHTFSFKHIFFLVYLLTLLTSWGSQLQIRPCLIKSKINRKLYDIGLQKTFSFYRKQTKRKANVFYYPFALQFCEMCHYIHYVPYIPYLRDKPLKKLL